MRSKKIFTLLMIKISIISIFGAIPLSYKIHNKQQFSRQFAENKANIYDRENLLLDTENRKELLLNNELITQSIKEQFNTYELNYLSKLDILSTQELANIQNIDHLVNQVEYEEELENNNSSLEALELLKKKKEQLEKSWAKQKQLINKQQKLKKVVIGASIGGALIAGISARNWFLFWN